MAKRGAEGSEADVSHDSESSSEDEVTVNKKGYSASVVWQRFGYLQSDVEQIKPVCKVCRRSVPSKTGNTTNLFNHLRKYHPAEHTEGLKMRTQSASLAQSNPSTSTSASTSGAATRPKQQSMVSSFAAIAPYERHSKRSKTITQANKKHDASKHCRERWI